MKTILEIFGDVLVRLRVFQTFQEGVRSFLDQQGALCVLRGQGTLHNLQILWRQRKVDEEAFTDTAGATDTHTHKQSSYFRVS